ncbi:MAG: MBL fold metallo-hydrolase [Candidatus Zixiibacteriota bacterium]
MHLRTNKWQGKSLSLEILKSQAGLSQGFWVEYDDKAILVDAGDGILSEIVKRKLPFKSLSAILITHGHFDHMAGLYAILAFFRMIGREKPLYIISPDGSKEIMAHFKLFTELYKKTIPFEIIPKNTDDRDGIDIGELHIKAYALYHCGSIEGGRILDRIPANGYRIEYLGEQIAISGDTGYVPALEELVKDTQLAIIEATFKDEDKVTDEMLQKVHLNEKLAHKAGELAENYILCHKILHR